MTDSHTHYSKGDLVHVTQGPHAGKLGHVVDMSNAGFQGLLYSLVSTTEQDTLHSIPAPWLELVHAVEPIKPWPGQATYRAGRRITAE